ncbi:MAG TPA: hypothetical protein VFL31_07385 [Nitrospiraceae bacterium]|nr:hypothetical protein [Nitrospiraceae bacterium]
MPFTLRKVEFSGTEKPFEIPEKKDLEGYLRMAAESFFGNNGLPQPIPLTFDPASAKGAVDEKAGGKAKAPKSKAALVAALITLPEYQDSEAALKKKKPDELKRLWNEHFGSGATSSQTPDPDNSGN